MTDLSHALKPLIPFVGLIIALFIGCLFSQQDGQS